MITNSSGSRHESSANENSKKVSLTPETAETISEKRNSGSEQNNAKENDPMKMDENLDEETVVEEEGSEACAGSEPADKCQTSPRDVFALPELRSSSGNNHSTGRNLLDNINQVKSG